MSGGRQSPVELNRNEFRRHGGLTPPRSEDHLQEWLLHPPSLVAIRLLRAVECQPRFLLILVGRVELRSHRQQKVHLCRVPERFVRPEDGCGKTFWQYLNRLKFQRRPHPPAERAAFVDCQKDLPDPTNLGGCSDGPSPVGRVESSEPAAERDDLPVSGGATFLPAAGSEDSTRPTGSVQLQEWLLHPSGGRPQRQVSNSSTMADRQSVLRKQLGKSFGDKLETCRHAGSGTILPIS